MGWLCYAGQQPSPLSQLATRCFEILRPHRVVAHPESTACKAQHSHGRAHLEVLSLHHVVAHPEGVGAAPQHELHGGARLGGHAAHARLAARHVHDALVLAADGDEGVDGRQAVAAALHHCLQRGRWGGWRCCRVGEQAGWLAAGGAAGARRSGWHPRGGRAGARMIQTHPQELAALRQANHVEAAAQLLHALQLIAHGGHLRRRSGNRERERLPCASWQLPPHFRRGSPARHLPPAGCRTWSFTLPQKEDRTSLASESSEPVEMLCTNTPAASQRGDSGIPIFFAWPTCAGVIPSAAGRARPAPHSMPGGPLTQVILDRAHQGPRARQRAAGVPHAVPDYHGLGRATIACGRGGVEGPGVRGGCAKEEADEADRHNPHDCAER